MAELNFDKLCQNVANEILDHAEYYGRTFREWLDILAKYVSEQEGAWKEKTERLTIREWQNLDPWECCGQYHYCARNPNEAGGCRKGCIVPKLYAKLAKFEDEKEANEREKKA